MVGCLKRFVGAALAEFESLFARGATASLEEAVYPGCCVPGSGPLRFRQVRSGGLIVEVGRCRVEPSGDFRLDVLFGTGVCPFVDPVDLACFWNGPLAEAFGLPPGPQPERAGQTLVEDLCEELSPGRPRGGSQAPGRKRPPTAEAFAARLGASVHGQDEAISRLSSLVVSQLAKRVPRRPATALLIGPSGVGKTTTAEALAGTLAAEGWPDAHLHRIDCNELGDDYDVHRFLGAAPGLVGYTEAPPLLAALRKGRCIVVLDEVDKAHAAVHAALYSLLDTGRLMAPNGEPVCAPETIVVMTSSQGADELASRLHRVAPGDRRAVDRAAREHLREEGWPRELIGRIDTIAVFRSLSEAACRGVAVQAISTLAAEYGLRVRSLPPVLADVVLDIAEGSDLGARGLYYAARQLLGETFAGAACDGAEAEVVLLSGPPPSVAPAP
jgi:DNA polymerase III delta prime subunit